MMTLKDVARKLRSHADFVGSLGGSGELMDSVDLGGLADAIDVLSQPQPVAQGEAAGFQDIRARIACDSESEWFVSLVHCGHTVRTAKTFPNREGAEGYLKGINLWLEGGDSPTRTIPTGHRVVPDGLEKDAARYQWLRDRLCVRWEMALDGEKHEALGMRPGFGFLRSTMDPAKGWTLPEFFDDHRQKTDNAIDKAMLAAAPDAGGV